MLYFLMYSRTFSRSHPIQGLSPYLAACNWYLDVYWSGSVADRIIVEKDSETSLNILGNLIPSKSFIIINLIRSQ